MATSNAHIKIPDQLCGAKHGTLLIGDTHYPVGVIAGDDGTLVVVNPATGALLTETTISGEVDVTDRSEAIKLTPLTLGTTATKVVTYDRSRSVVDSK